MIDLKDPVLPKIMQNLKDQYGCHTIILYGSRARGEATDRSDYDILGIRDQGEFERDCRLMDGFYLDAFIYTVDDVKEPDPSLIRIKDGVVVCQKMRIGDELLDKIKKILQKEAPKTLDWEKHEIAQWVFKMLARAKHNDIEANFRRHWLLFDLLECYFKLRDQWYFGPKESFAWLKKNDLEVYLSFETALKPKADIKTLEKLIECVLNLRPSV